MISRFANDVMPGPGRKVRRSPRRQRVIGTLLFAEFANEPSLDSVIRQNLMIFSGREMKMSDGSLVALFDVPADAVRCAIGIRDEARSLALEFRCAVHAGGIELRGSDVCGPAVQVCRRLVDQAEPGEVLGTAPVVELAASLDFSYRGRYRLDGLRGFWPLFAAQSDRVSEPQGA